MKQVLPVEGTIAPDSPLIARLDGDASGSFSIGAIPVKVHHADGEYRYQVEAFGAIRGTVPRTEGLRFDASLQEGALHVGLVAPTGEFTSQGCEPVPGTLIPPGHYVQASAAGDSATFDVYESVAERALSGQRVDAEITILGTE